MLEASVAKLTRDELGAAVLDMISALEEAVCPEESAGFLDTHGIFLLLDCSEVDERTRQVVCSTFCNVSVSTTYTQAWPWTVPFIYRVSSPGQSL